ncbi:MAG: hypothetical protein SFY80_16990 [Verrucomicrobiota bacterium]|nr:hypothetical protein [Verrucomicrobiota bacterium]
MLDEAKLQIRAGRYRMATAGAVTDQTLMAVATEYENTVSRKIVSLVPDDLARRFPGNEPVLATLKYDGEGVFVYFEAGKFCFCFNAPSGRMRLGFPALDWLEKKLTAQGVRRCLLRCELWLPPEPGAIRRKGVSDVIRASFSGKEEDIAGLRLIVIDIVMLDGKDHRPNLAQFQTTWDALATLAGTDTTAPCFRMAGSIISEKQVVSWFNEQVSAGAEGLVIRRLQRAEALKIKPFRTIDAVVIGFVEGEFEEQYGVTSLLMALSHPEAVDAPLMLQTFGRVGTGLSDELRVSLLDNLRSMKVVAPLTMTDSDGRAVHFVKPTLIAEIAGEDLTPLAGKGAENRTQTFVWDKASGTYKFVGLAACPRLTFARFQHWREDKSLASGGARITQIVESAPKPEVKAPTVAAPVVLRREVYAKGTEAVRKLIVIQQPEAEGQFPYVIFWSDYSTKRAEPLKVTTQYADTESRANALADKLVVEGVTRGFVPYDPHAYLATAADNTPKPPTKKKAKKEEPE